MHDLMTDERYLPSSRYFYNLEHVDLVACCILIA